MPDNQTTEDDMAAKVADAARRGFSTANERIRAVSGYGAARLLPIGVCLKALLLLADEARELQEQANG